MKGNAAINNCFQEYKHGYTVMYPTAFHQNLSTISKNEIVANYGIKLSVDIT
jgi:hypothetical protein